jgi:hypothetical protein
VEANKNPDAKIIEAKLDGIAEIEKGCDLVDVSIREWAGGKDDIREARFTGEHVLERDFNEH